MNLRQASRALRQQVATVLLTLTVACRVVARLLAPRATAVLRLLPLRRSISVSIGAFDDALAADDAAPRRCAGWRSLIKPLPLLPPPQPEPFVVYAAARSSAMATATATATTTTTMVMTTLEKASFSAAAAAAAIVIVIVAVALLRPGTVFFVGYGRQ